MMRRTWCVLPFLAVALVFATQHSSAGTGIRVDESSTKLSVRGEQISVALGVVNSRGSDFTARVTIELIDPRNRVRAAAERDVTIPPGSSTIAIPIPFREHLLNNDTRKQVLWFRLRYQINEPGNAAKSEGIVSLSEITPDLFELRVATSRQTRPGSRLRALVRAVHPTRRLPVSGVAVEGGIDIDKNQHLKASGVTNSEGYATLDFDLPAKITVGEAALKVSGRLANLTQEVEDEIELDRYARILTSTDKPLYQPGQLLHMRALVFDSSNRAVAGHDAALKITDPDNTLVFRAALKTSRFGVASGDWRIPDNARLGQYMILVEMDDEQFQNSTGGQRISISRYDLPNFTVSAKPDRAYYLPGQNAEVELRADYLFGQPVKRGQARIVRETEREWNFREQKWEIEEGDKYEGEIEEGRFVARIDLADEHERIYDEDYSRFRDVEYAAYVTDSTTGRTEQRRFRLRVTKEPIHIYVLKEPSADGFPLQFYVSTFYADGAPAECEVSIAEDPDSRTEYEPGAGASAGPLRTIKTNHYGVAKVADLHLPKRPRVSSKRYYERSVMLILKARDAKGRIGHRDEDFWFGYDDRPVVRVQTNKPLYRAGDAIEVTITANEPNLSLVVDAAHDSKVIYSKTVSLHGGRVSTTIPYCPDFRDELTIAAYAIGEGSESVSGSRTVIYPRERDLKLDVRLQQPIYKPGEEARADFRVRAPDGRAVESALGVVVLDKAVEERARTKQEFGGGGAGFYGAFLNDDQLAGITRKDLDHVDLSKPLPNDLELVAEMLLAKRGGYWPKVFGEAEFETDAHKVFAPVIDAQMKPIKDALTTRYARTKVYPASERELRRMLGEFGIDFDAMRDPWGAPYRAAFSIDKQMDVLEIASAGADKRFGSADDFTVARMSWPYFRSYGEAIGRALTQYHKRTAEYIRELTTLKRELAREGVNLDELGDRWGRPYSFEFGVENTFFTVSVKSGGANGRFDETNNSASDDFTIWTARIDYFEETRAKLDEAITAYFKSTSRFPQDEAEFAEVLKQAGIDPQSLRDGWGRRCNAVFKTEARYADRVIVQSYAKYKEAPTQRADVWPVTEEVNFVFMRSAGPDGKRGTSDDFNLASLSRVVAEQSSRDPMPKPARVSAIFFGATGAISGLVTDLQGAVISGAKVTATHKASSLTYEAEGNNDGRYVLRNLPAGIYEVRLQATGFQAMVFTDVPVSSSNVTELNASLNAGGVSETVMVSAGGAPLVQTETSSQVGFTIDGRQVNSLPLKGRNLVNVVTKSGTSGQMATPRLREYFPETLVWQPSIETDAEGRAQLKFKLADNITTWKVGVVASTIDGQIGIAEEELRAFQPFFIEHDPPRVLTEGDEIMLPVVLRNYLDKTQAVDVEMKPESWFTLLSPARKRSDIPTGDAAREVFAFRAIAPITEGRQRVTATGSDASDAIEKPVSVHPDGQEIAETASQVFTDSGVLDLNIPATAIKGTARAELKIYPNLMAHVIEGIEAIMQRPYGCGEQTLSSTYPSLMVLRYYSRRNEDVPPAAERARRYLQAGYERLLNYRSEDGGFTYWGRGEADLALTAYALRFLNDARGLIAVDDDVIQDAREWLIKHQREEGSWPAHRWSGDEDKRSTASLTSFIARVLASSGNKSTDKSDSHSINQAQANATALKRALNYLAPRTAEIDEPYAIASYALAAFDAGEIEAASNAVDRLRGLARDESSAAYWTLEANTPFYGWGLAGRIETTALAVQAMARDCGLRNTDCGFGKATSTPKAATQSQNNLQSKIGNPQLINRGLLFLVRQKDRYGVWHSTQATVNVLDALTSLLSNERPDVRQSTAPAEILVNGKRVASVAMPPADQLTGPIAVDLSPFLSTGASRVEIRRDHAPQASAQLIASYYTPWTARTATAVSAKQQGSTSALRLRVSYNKTEAKIGDEITCKVEAERIGFHGYGMMLAEIGLPPGADVDRDSLERAVKESGWGVNQYDVLPDRVIVYLWPAAGGTRFEFKFRPRFGIAALAASSLVYDYYNPEARAVVAPTKFVVK